MDKEKSMETPLEEEKILTEEESCKEAEKLEDEEFQSKLEKEKDEVMAKLKEENLKLLNEVDSLKDRLMRLGAEYDNFRKRTAKEKEGIYTDACEDVLKNMLPVLDNLERAAVSDGDIEDIKKGIEMTLRQFQDSLSKVQVEEISTDGEFDPNYHNAVMHVEDENYGTNQIVEVFQKGYKREEKVIRYSMVKVAN